MEKIGGSFVVMKFVILRREILVSVKHVKGQCVCYLYRKILVLNYPNIYGRKMP